MPRIGLLLGLLALPGAAAAQPVPADETPTIVVTGSGEASAVPDYTEISLTVRGEGATPTEALASLSRQRSAIEAGVRSVRDAAALDVSTSQISTQDVRGPKCSPARPYMAAQELSVGDCAVIGVIATLQMEAKVTPAAKAGDIASMATQLGAKSISIRGSGFKDEDELTDRAAERAVANARREAELIARAAGGRLGPVRRIQDQVFSAVPQEVTVTGARLAAPAAPAPPPPPPLAVPLVFAPQPITRSARVTVTFALEPGPAPSR